MDKNMRRTRGTRHTRYPAPERGKELGPYFGIRKFGEQPRVSKDADRGRWGRTSPQERGTSALTHRKKRGTKRGSVFWHQNCATKSAHEQYVCAFCGGNCGPHYGPYFFTALRSLFVKASFPQTLKVLEGGKVV